MPATLNYIECGRKAQRMSIRCAFLIPCCNKTAAVVQRGEVLMKDVRSALGLMITVKYAAGCSRINKTKSRNKLPESTMRAIRTFITGKGILSTASVFYGSPSHFENKQRTKA